MTKRNLTLVVNRTGTDQDFFESKEAYEDYKRRDEELRKEPLAPLFDWRYFLKVLFGRV